MSTSKSDVTKHSSFELLYGHRDLQPFELFININIEQKNEFENEEEYLLDSLLTINGFEKQLETLR